MKFLKCFLCVMYLSVCVQAQVGNTFPAAVKEALNAAGANKQEILTALNHFYKSGNAEKIEAVNFLVTNMSLHYSETYVWKDKQGKEIPFNELNYPGFQASIEAFEKLKKQHPGIHPSVLIIPDLSQVKARFLINNVEEALLRWHESALKNYPFKEFCEFILPYRAASEPLQQWRNVYQQKFSKLVNTNRGSMNSLLDTLLNDYKSWFSYSSRNENADEPLPRLGALQLLHRKTGKCQDVADLEVLSLRSIGLPAALDIIPYWGTSSGGHLVNTTFDEKGQPLHFDFGNAENYKAGLSREPGKVFRITYSKQQNTLAAIQSKAHIPRGVLQLANYRDVTREYWPVQAINCQISAAADKEIVYACVFNAFKWQPIWWAHAANGHASFNDMAKGVVYLPAVYRNGKMMPVGMPFANGYNHTLQLKPDSTHRRTITIAQQEKYLLFRPGSTYRLFYWSDGWQLLDSKKTSPGQEYLVFNNVPDNCLLLLQPDYSRMKERPFIIVENNKRIWF